MAVAEVELRPGQYYTLLAPVDSETMVKRSRFIASLRRAGNREEAAAALKEIAACYPNANHYCWAYRFTGSPAPEHASDAGEPPGTAGRPILGALKRHSLQNIVAVVTRYFGGVKLGVRGLIAAYGTAALTAIEKGKIVVEEPSSRLIFRCSYDLYNILLAKLERASVDASAMKTAFAENISGETTIPNSLLPWLVSELDSIGAPAVNFEYEIHSPAR